MKNWMKLALPLALFSAIPAAHACSISYSATDKLTKEIKENKFDFQGYKKLCNELKKNNASINLTGTSFVGSGANVSNVMVRLEYKDLGIFSSLAIRNHIIDVSRASEKTAQANQYKAAMGALETIADESDKFFASLKQSVDRARSSGASIHN